MDECDQLSINRMHVEVFKVARSNRKAQPKFTSVQSQFVEKLLTTIICISVPRLPHGDIFKNKVSCYISIGWRENFTQQTQAPANRNARSKQWQP